MRVASCRTLVTASVCASTSLMSSAPRDVVGHDVAFVVGVASPYLHSAI